MFWICEIDHFGHELEAILSGKGYFLSFYGFSLKLFQN